MPVDLAELLDPAHTAVLTMELQRGVVGDTSTLRELADEVAATGVVEKTARVVRAARAAGARVVHCTAEFRADRAGSSVNAPLLTALSKIEGRLVSGSADAAIMPELGPEPTDIVCSRVHGLTPFPGTELDPILRNLGVSTVVATGASLNVGIPGLVMVAVDLGYRVAVVTDAVAGIPREYGQEVIRHTLAPLATRVTTDEIVAVWGS
jgi:nicotinamidase-related amidase